MNSADDEAARHAFEGNEKPTEGHGEKDSAGASDWHSNGEGPANDGYDEADPLHNLIQRTKANPGAPFETKVLAALLYLRRDNRAGFENLLRELKAVDCRTHELEKALKEIEAKPAGNRERSGGRRRNGESASAQGNHGGLEVTALIKSVEPWPVSVNVAILIGRMAVTLRRYIIMTKDQALACAVWSIFTHCIDALDYSPRLRITAPARRCGKTNLLTLIGYLSRRSLMATGITAAPLFRTIAACNPTLLIDEFDKIRKDDADIHAILNAGITRETAYVLRCVGDNHTPTAFPVFSPMAYDGIGRVWPQLLDRSITIYLKRKLKSEKTARMPRRQVANFIKLARMAARVATDHAKVLSNARPHMPDAFYNRVGDVWEPLLAIADRGGIECGKRLRKAAMNLAGAAGIDDEDDGETIISDIRSIRDERAAIANRNGVMPDAAIFSKDLVDTLTKIPDGPYEEWGASRKPLSQKKLATALADYRVRPGTVRVGPLTGKGYYWANFKDTFERFIEGGEEASS